MNKLEEVEDKIVDQMHSTKGIIIDLAIKFDKVHVSKYEKPIPTSFLYKRNIQIQNPVKPANRFPYLFPKEAPQSLPESSKEKANTSDQIFIASLFKELEKEPESQILPIYEPLESQFSKYSAPDLNGKGRGPETHTFFPDSHREWNIDNLSVGQIRKMIDMMFTEYKLMCLRGKNEVEACKTIIQCFTGTLLPWWETESSPTLLDKMEKELLKDEAGDIIHNIDGTPQNNMIGALTSMILEHWCSSETEIANKHEIILMNLKCNKMS